jgi:hypothetical protein
MWTEAYLMALSYYSTHGDDWALQLGFVDPAIADVCSWKMENPDTVFLSST